MEQPTLGILVLKLLSGLAIIGMGWLIGSVLAGFASRMTWDLILVGWRLGGL